MSPPRSTASAGSGKETEAESDGEGDVTPPPSVINYTDLSEEAMELDSCLFNTLFTIVQGPYLQLLIDLMGAYGRYTLGIIAMWEHAELGASSR